jgi:hypothetical protein
MRAVREKEEIRKKPELCRSLRAAAAANMTTVSRAAIPVHIDLCVTARSHASETFDALLGIDEKTKGTRPLSGLAVLVVV